MKIFGWVKRNLIKVLLLIAVGALLTKFVPQVDKAASDVAKKIKP
jgi:hypothetical protein